MKTMTRRAGIAALLAIAVAVGFALPRTAAAAEAAEAPAYAEEEMDDCLGCHDEDAKSPVLPILATQHAVKADGRTPLAQQHECQTCHGPSAAHIDDEDTRPAIRFGPDLPAGPQNEVCLGCHQGGSGSTGRAACTRLRKSPARAATRFTSWKTRSWSRTADRTHR